MRVIRISVVFFSLKIPYNERKIKKIQRESLCIFLFQV
jgi:hypothetical protein